MLQGDADHESGKLNPSTTTEGLLYVTPSSRISVGWSNGMAMPTTVRPSPRSSRSTGEAR
jgi:hypothetical protein